MRKGLSIVYNDKLKVGYVRTGLRKYLPEELMPNSFSLMEWTMRLRSWARREKEKGFSDEWISDCIDRHIKLAAQRHIKEQGA